MYRMVMNNFAFGMYTSHHHFVNLHAIQKQHEGEDFRGWELSFVCLIVPHG